MQQLTAGEICRRIISRIEVRPMSSTELAIDLGIPEPTIKEAIRLLDREHKIDAIDRGLGPEICLKGQADDWTKGREKEFGAPGFRVQGGASPNRVSA